MSQTQLQSNDNTEIVDTEETPVSEETSDTADQNTEDSGETQRQEFDPKERVTFNTPEQQKKFNDVYKQMKMSDSRNKMQADMLAKAMDKISELESRFSQTDHAEAEKILTTRLKEAREAGDEDRADKILQEIVDFKVDSKLRDKIEKPKIASSLADADPEDAENARVIVQYAQETDNNGNLLRPWINQSHPQHKNFMKLAAATALTVNAELGYLDVEETMKRMDDAMKSKPKTAQVNSRAPDPMRGNLTNTPPRGKIKLSSQELAAAQKLGVKPEDYLKWKR